MKKFKDGGGGKGCRWFLGSMDNFENWSLCIESWLCGSSVKRLVLVYNFYIRYLCFTVCLFCVLFTHNTLYSRWPRFYRDLVNERHARTNRGKNCIVLLAGVCGMLALLLDSCFFSLFWPTINAEDMFLMYDTAKTRLWLTETFSC